MSILSFFRRAGAPATPPPPGLKIVATPMSSSNVKNATDTLKALRLPNFTSGDETVTIIAANKSGSELRKFVVHKEFACYHSPVLKAAFDGDFIESQTKTYELKDTEGPVTQLFVNWLYTQKIDLDEPQPGIDGWGLRFSRNNLAVRLWVLGDMLIILRLQNQVIDHIWKTHSTIKATSIDCFQYIYDNTSSSSPLRRVMITLCAQNTFKNHYSEYIDYFPKEMLAELLQVFAKHCRSGYTHETSTVPTETQESFHVEEK